VLREAALEGLAEQRVGGVLVRAGRTARQVGVERGLHPGGQPPAPGVQEQGARLLAGHGA